MANFSFVSNAQYRPRSFQEILQPLQMYTDEYNQVQEGLGELSTQAGVFENLANQQSDPDTYELYKKFANDLEAQATELAANGLNPVSRKGLLDMKRRYSNEIVPIDVAYKRRQEITDEQRKARYNDPYLMVSREASLLSLDELIKNPSLSPTSTSGTAIKKISAQAASAFAKGTGNNPRKWRKILGDQYFETVMRPGATQEEVMKAIQGASDANPELRKIMEDAVLSSGILDWEGVRNKDGSLSQNGQRLFDQAMGYAGLGLWDAIGETKYQTLQNKQWGLDPEGDKNKPKPKSLPYRPVPKTKVIGENHSQLQKDKQFLKDLAEGKIDRTKTAKRSSMSQGYNVPGGVGFQRKWAEDEEYNVFEEQVKDITSRYGTTDPQEINKLIDQRTAQSAIRDFSYVMNSQDSKVITEPIMENLKLEASMGSYTFTEINKDGKKSSSKMKSGDLQNILVNHDEGRTLLKYDNDNRITLVSTNKEGESKTYMVDPEMLGGTDSFYSNSYKALDYYAEKGNKEAYNAVLNNMFTSLIEQANSRYQTRTRSSNDPF